VKKYNKEENEFVAYLIRNNDTYGLDAMGLINKYGIREERLNTLKNISMEKLMYKYNETNCYNYIKFYTACNLYVKQKIGLFVLLVLNMFIFFIIRGIIIS